MPKISPATVFRTSGLQLQTRVFSCEYSKSFRNNFFIEQLQWLFLNYILVSERFLKKDLLNFFITKYLKKEFDDDLTVGMDERNPCGLSVTGDNLITVANL